MAKFTIYSPDGVALYTGTPSFTGQYMKPGMLEFREISSPRLIDFTAGCYVGYEENGSVIPQYSRTGYTYKLYSVPQVKKQARAYSYGAAFVYQGVQFFDASKELELCPFRDLVKGDNRVHFSTQPSITTFEGCDGLARRFEACLVEQYGANSWQVRIATTDDGVTEDFYNLMMDAREFTVSGVNILQCLDKIYEIWPEVGWIYTVESVGGTPTNTIIIGGAGLNANQGTYAYGKGRGLTSITRTVANADEMANRIYAYGDARNMLPKWYNDQNIKDKQSVDIQNLMIPVSHWGTTDNLPDASKAYVEDAASIARIGLRPKTIYFDGSAEYPDIYPTIRNKTINDLWDAMSSSDQYYPDSSIYSGSERIDTLRSVPSGFDSGLAGSGSGKDTIFNEYKNYVASDTQTVASGTKYILQTILTEDFTFGSSDAGTRDVTISVSMEGYVQLAGLQTASVTAYLRKGHPGSAAILTQQVDLTQDNNNPGTFYFNPITLYGSKNAIDEATYYLVIDLELELAGSETDLTLEYNADCNMSVTLSNYRSKTFMVTLRQLGFDINAQAALGEGKAIAMRSGKCQGRTFTINSVQYDEVYDAWTLECFRSEDESLSQWFPNTAYPVEANDEFVLLDIAMPSVYISMAENQLYQAALDLLSDTAVERWQYIPEIDAKYMVENSRVIRSGEYMAILDMDFIEAAPGTASYFLTSNSQYLLTSNGERIRLDNGSGSVTTALVDSIVINEGEAAIPTYKVTLRDRKKKTWTESKGAEVPSSKSVGSITDTKTAQSTSTSAVDSKYFTLDDNGNITLKPQYSNLWVPGWMAAGGVGTEGGGGGVSFLKELGDVYHNDSNVLRADGTGVQPGDALVYDTTHGWVAAVQSGGISSVVLSAGSANGTLKLTVDGVAGSDVSVPGLGSFAYKNSLSASDIPSLSYLPLSGGELSGDLRLKGSSNYGRTLRFGDGNYAYISEDTDDHFKIYAANGIELSTGSGHDVTVNGVPLDWFTVETVNNSPTLKLNPRYAGLWAEGWVAAGGVGTGSGGGGTYIAGDGINISSNNVISVVAATTSVLGGVKVDGTTISINNNGVISAIGGGGGISSVSLASGTNNGTLKLTVDGSVTDNIAVKGLGSLAYKSSLSASDIPTLNYLPLSGGELTGDLRLKGNTNYGRKLRFGDGDYAYLHEDSDDHLTIFADRGITLSSNTDYGIETDNFIDIGNARLIFDEGTNALHVTKKSGTSATIGLFADGFVAAGGVSGQTTMSYVDLESNQTVGGNKTFSGTTQLGQTMIGTISILGSGTAPYINNILDRIYIQRAGQTGVSMCATAGQVVIGALNTTNTSKLFVNGNAAFTYSTGNTISISEIVSRIEALENA